MFLTRRVIPFVLAITVVVVVAMVSARLTLAQGGVIAYGQVVTGSLTAQTPLALYTFQGAEGDLAAAQVIGLSPPLTPSLQMLNSSGQVVSTGTSQASAFSNDASLTARLPQTGLYTLVVSDVNNQPGEFILRLAVRGNSGSPTVPASGSLDLPVESFHQTFVIAGDPLNPTLVTLSAEGAAAFAVEILDTNGQPLALFSAQAIVNFTLPSGGPFYLILTNLNPGTPGSVTISVSSGGSAESTPTPIPQPEISPTPATACQVVAGNSVNVRSGPGTGYSIISQLTSGQNAPATGVNGGWYLITLSNGTTGWVFGNVVQLQGDCSSVPFVPFDPLVTPTATVIVPSTPTSTLPPGLTPTVAPPTTTLTATNTPPPGVTFTLPAPTATFTATNTPPPGVTFTLPPPTATLTMTSTQQPLTATFPPPTGTTEPPTVTFPPPTATATLQPPTATFTPSYTPTTPPPVPTAPPDGNFNSPLTIPLDTTSSVTDFVSYPGGDTVDRVRYSVSGMNPNTALSGGRARLIIAVSCFGTGTTNVQISSGGQTVSCGQTIVDREVTADSDTGTITITAVGGDATYVQWVLTGTATRIN